MKGNHNQKDTARALKTQHSKTPGQGEHHKEKTRTTTTQRELNRDQNIKEVKGKIVGKRDICRLCKIKVLILETLLYAGPFSFCFSTPPIPRQLSCPKTFILGPQNYSSWQRKGNLLGLCVGEGSGRGRQTGKKKNPHTSPTKLKTSRTCLASRGFDRLYSYATKTRRNKRKENRNEEIVHYAEKEGCKRG